MPAGGAAPIGFKRSRALWDNARRRHETWTAAGMSYMRAMLYELQPIRFSQLTATVGGGGLHHHWKQYWVRLVRIIETVVLVQVPAGIGCLVSFLSSLTLRQWLWIGGVVLYYFVVRWIHFTMEAGPVLLISTALVIIFTVGLDDNNDDSSDGISAYTVFNRGFRRLLGSVDEQELLAQHVGGGGFGMVGGGGGAWNDDPNDDLLFQEDVPPPPRPAVRGARPPRPAAEGDDRRAAVGNHEQHPERPQRARRSGKKSRRRNLEQRREMRRQREAAAAMGFHGGGQDAEAQAMQQLLELQILEAENNPNYSYSDEEEEEEDEQ